MLEHQKRVLQGVSHNPYLFKKELIKSLHWLTISEQVLFKKWVYENYYHLYPEAIDTIIGKYAQNESEIIY